MNEKENSKISSRRENRAAAMQFLYMHAVSPEIPLERALEDFFESKENDRSFYTFSEELIAGYEANKEKVDEVLTSSAQNWTLDRMARVDVAILRLAIFELLYREDIPPVVSINEAIDLAKEYSSADSRRFINGVLDKVKTTLTRPLRSANRK